MTHLKFPLPGRSTHSPRRSASPGRSATARARGATLLASGLACFVTASVGEAQAGPARSEAMGGVDLFYEDSTNVFTNPATFASHSHRLWFSLGGAGAVGSLPSFDPHGGVSVRIRNVVSLGLVLNRNPNLYGFGAALMPVANQYIDGGPGGVLEGADGPSETTEPIRFPLDFFVGLGDPWSRLRVGLNVYYGGGSNRSWTIDDEDNDGVQDIEIIRKQTHLWNVAFGLSGGAEGAAVRPDVWLRIGMLSAWHDERSGSGPGGSSGSASDGITDVRSDRILSLDRDIRIGLGARAHLATPVTGLSVVPALQYDVAIGAIRFDDNMVNPDSDAELSQRAATGHEARAGLGLTWNHDDLLVHGSLSAAVTAVNVRDEVHDDDEITQSRRLAVQMRLPEIALAAEYRIAPPLLLRGSVKGTVLGGRTLDQQTDGVGAWPDPDDRLVEQGMGMLDPRVTVTATGGFGLEIKRFRLDANLGGAFLGGTVPTLLGRLDAGFVFN